jgi:hypothetical protein
MTSWPDFLAQARLVYADNRTPRLTDAQYLTLANLALKTISRDMPRKAVHTYTANGQRVFQLPADFLRAVELHLLTTGSETVLRELQVRPGETLAPKPGATPEYRIPWPQEGQLALTRNLETGETLELHYAGSWPAITPTGTLPFGSRTWLEEALLLYTGYLVFTSHASVRAQNEQWAARPELQVDNPLEQQARFFLESYQRLVAVNR